MIKNVNKKIKYTDSGQAKPQSQSTSRLHNKVETIIGSQAVDPLDTALKVELDHPFVLYLTGSDKPRLDGHPATRPLAVGNSQVFALGSKNFFLYHGAYL